MLWTYELFEAREINYFKEQGLFFEKDVLMSSSGFDFRIPANFFNGCLGKISENSGTPKNVVLITVFQMNNSKRFLRAVP